MLIETWRIEMFGGLNLLRGEETVTRFKSQKIASLLAYLAFYPARQHMREDLLALVWPDDDLDAARNRLRVGLSSLRRQLEPPGIVAGEVLIADRIMVGLRSEAFSTDVAHFENVYAAALHTEEPAEQVRLLTAAVEAYGGALLPGYFEDWVLAERERLAHSYFEALRRLVLCLSRQGDFERALIYANRAVRSDPYREEAHRDVMRLYAAIGQPSAAMEQYEKLVRLYRDSFGAEPSASLQSLARQIASTLGHSSHLQVGSSLQAVPIEVRALQPSALPQPPDARGTSHRSPSVSRSVLPLALTRFFGREREQEVLCALLLPGRLSCTTTQTDSNPTDRTGRSRLITLTGIGGTGKTRLADAVARRLREAYADRIWFVPLADLLDASQIGDAIIEAMRLPRERNLDSLSQILKALGGEPALLVLDNFELLVQGGDSLIEMLLSQLEKLVCLVTSRRPLGVSGEQEFPVVPLPVPAKVIEQGNIVLRHLSLSASIADLLLNPAVALFVDRAKAVRPDFQLTPHNADDIAALCRELEGIPLAIELAAARSRLLTPGQMRSYLPRRFELLVNRRAGKDVRHRSLHATLVWSYQLLSPDLCRVFALLSVFRSGANMPAVQAVCSDQDALQALEELHADSLIQVEEVAGEMRFKILETVREFASEHLDESEREAALWRHADWYVRLAEEAEQRLLGSQQSLWLDRLQCERENIRLAYETLLSGPDGTAGALRLTRSLWRFWMFRGDLKEGRRWADATLARPCSDDSVELYVDALNAAGAMASAQEDYASARALYEREISLSRKIGYRKGIAWGSANLGNLEIRCGNFPVARSWLEEGLALHRQIENRRGIALCLSFLGLAEDKLGNTERAKRLYNEGLELHRELGDDVQIASILGNLGLIAAREDDDVKARSLQEQSLAIHQRLGNRAGAAMASGNLGVVAMKQGEHSQARERFMDCLQLFQELEMPHAAALALGELGFLELLSGNYQEARRFQEEKLEIERRLDSREGVLAALNLLGLILIKMHEYEQAGGCLTESLTLARATEFQLGIASALEGFAVLAHAQRQNERAVWLFGAAESLRIALGAPLPPLQLNALQIPLHSLLEDPGCIAAYVRGKSTPLESAIETALSGEIGQ